jgi:hypothetical protein
MNEATPTETPSVYGDSQRRRAVIRALSGRHPGASITDLIADAGAILHEFDMLGPTAELHEVPAASLTQEQGIRARALDSAALMLGAGVAAELEEMAVDDASTARHYLDVVSCVWRTLAADGAAFIVDATVPAWPPSDDDRADGEDGSA